MPGLTIDLGDQGLHRFRFIQIRRNRLNLAFAFDLEFALSRIQFCLVATDKNDCATLVGQQSCRGETHAARATNNETQSFCGGSCHIKEIFLVVAARGRLRTDASSRLKGFAGRARSFKRESAHRLAPQPPHRSLLGNLRRRSDAKVRIKCPSVRISGSHHD